VGIAEWPPESSFDEGPVTRYLFRVPSVPARMVPLLTSTPGLGVFLPVTPGAAVEVGYHHPVNLRACPVFNEAGLVLFRGGGRDVLELSRMPALGDVSAFARVELRKEVAVARAPHGVVEAIEMPGATAFLLGVQWELHEEWQDDDRTLAIWRAFVEAAAARADAREAATVA